MAKVAPEANDDHAPHVVVHAAIHKDLGSHHEVALETRLKDCTDEQILAEIARRGIDVKHSVTEETIKENYIFEKFLGEGASGQVHLVKHKKTGHHFACKVIKKDGSMNDADSMSTEIEIMKHIRHKHVVGLYELFESNLCMWLILELVQGGDLNFFISHAEHYSEQVVSHLFAQILKGVHYLHSRGIVHRDLKLDNILLHGSVQGGDVKIADFGLSALVKVGSPGYDKSESVKRKEYRGLHEMWGTATYFAPELIDGAYGPQADVWSIGCILYEMLSGSHPFDAENDDELFAKIKGAQFTIEGGAWGHISAGARDLVKKLLTVDPALRLSCTEALRHPWITGEGLDESHGKHLSDSHDAIRRRVDAKGATTAASPTAAGAAAAAGTTGAGEEAASPKPKAPKRGLMSFLSHPSFLGFGPPPQGQ